MDYTKQYRNYVVKENIKIPIYVDLMATPNSGNRFFLGVYTFEDGVFILNSFGCKDIVLTDIPKRSYWGYYGDVSMKTVLLGQFLIPGENYENYQNLLYSLKNKYHYEEN